jgi:hypothetical protein
MLKEHTYAAAPSTDDGRDYVGHCESFTRRMQKNMDYRVPVVRSCHRINKIAERKQRFASSSHVNRQ